MWARVRVVGCCRILQDAARCGGVLRKGGRLLHARRIPHFASSSFLSVYLLSFLPSAPAPSFSPGCVARVGTRQGPFFSSSCLPHPIASLAHRYPVRVNHPNCLAEVITSCISQSSLPMHRMCLLGVVTSLSRRVRCQCIAETRRSYHEFLSQSSLPVSRRSHRRVRCQCLAGVIAEFVASASQCLAGDFTSCGSQSSLPACRMRLAGVIACLSCKFCLGSLVARDHIRSGLRCVSFASLWMCCRRNSLRALSLASVATDRADQFDGHVDLLPPSGIGRPSKPKTTLNPAGLSCLVSFASSGVGERQAPWTS